MTTSEEDTVRLTIFLPKDTDLLLRTHLARVGMCKSAISKFVADTVRWQLFHLNLEAAQAHNLDVSSEQIEDEIGTGARRSAQGTLCKTCVMRGLFSTRTSC